MNAGHKPSLRNSRATFSSSHALVQLLGHVTEVVLARAHREPSRRLVVPREQPPQPRTPSFQSPALAAPAQRVLTGAVSLVRVDLRQRRTLVQLGRMADATELAVLTCQSRSREHDGRLVASPVVPTHVLLTSGVPVGMAVFHRHRHDPQFHTDGQEHDAPPSCTPRRSQCDAKGPLQSSGSLKRPGGSTTP